MITANAKAQLQIRTFKEKQSKTKKQFLSIPSYWTGMGNNGTIQILKDVCVH